MDRKDRAVERGLVSIIVPIYNIEKYLERCINSIMNQTYKNIEVILVDDGSTDGSGKICDCYERMDTRVSVFHEKHGGTSRARNIGLSHAKGDFIGFVDSDDYIEPDMYETLLCYMDDEVDLVCCGRRRVIPGGKSFNAYCVGAVRKFSSQKAVEELLLNRGISYSVCTKLFRSELFQGIRFPIGKNSEDMPVAYDLIKKSRNIVHIGKAKYYNFYRENSRSTYSNDPRLMNPVIFSRDILIDVKKNFPLLEKQAEARYLMNTFVALQGMHRSKGEYSKVEARLKKMLHRMFFRGMLNPYLKESDKKTLLKCVLSCNVDRPKI